MQVGTARVQAAAVGGLQAGAVRGHRLQLAPCRCLPLRLSQPSSHCHEAFATLKHVLSGFHCCLLQDQCGAAGHERRHRCRDDGVR